MDAEEVRRALAAADAAYQSFPSVATWAQEAVALGSWDDAAEHLASVRAAAPVDAVNAALDEVLRAAAVDTGALEGLYPTNRGFTMSVARNVISLDQAEVEAGLGFRGSFEAQLRGFEHAVRLATEDRPVTEADIRDLHQITCAEQETYRVLTDHGVQERELVTGRYKSDPNHVQLGDGRWHSYAPVDEVGAEMHRLVDDLGTDVFAAAPPVVQAAFVHHAFTSVHPFPDGNGRVARLLASIPLLRAASIPLWVEDADKDVYLDALARADAGDRQPFLRLITSLTLRLMRELALTIGRPPAPAGPAPVEVAAQVVAAALAEQLRNELADTPGAEVMHPIGIRLPTPREVWVPHGDVAVVFSPSGNRIGPDARGVVVGVDDAADDLGRIVVLVFDNPLNGEVVAEHRIGVDEAIPGPTGALTRRLGLVVRSLVADSRRSLPG
ncbi:MAG TPA: Fic family protein [Iamia sp.]|nr:Fic family protein [Iamia sp.]